MSQTGLPTQAEGVTSAWLTAALRTHGRLPPDEHLNVELCEPLSAGTAFATKMYRLHLSGTDALPDTAVMKLPVTGEVRAFLDAMAVYERETTFYNEIAPQLPIRTPECYLSVRATDSTDFVLIIEDLCDATPGDALVGLTHQQAEVAVQTLAAFHAWSWESPLLDAQVTFPRLDGATSALLGQTFELCWPAVEAAYPIARRISAFGRGFADIMPWFVEHLATPLTLSHGELRADNLFLRPDGVTLIDFQTVCQQSGMIDLSYLISQSLPSELRRAHEHQLVSRYVAALEAAGVSDYAVDDAHRQYRIGVAFNLVWACLMHGQIERLDQRGRDLVATMITRAVESITDNESLSLVPERLLHVAR